MDFLKDFGVQPVLLAAQVINFLVLLYLLKRFLYKPILKVLDERKKRIADSLKNSEEIENRLKKIGEEEEKSLQKSADQAAKIIKEAKEEGLILIEEARARSAEEAEKILKSAREDLERDRQRIEKELKENLSTFMVTALQKVTGKVLTEKDQKELIGKSLKDLK